MQDFKQYLNPVYKEVDTYIKNSSRDGDSQLEKEEYPHLHKTLTTIGDKVDKQLFFIQKLKEDIAKQEELIESETGDDKSDAVKEMNKLLKQMDRLLTTTNRFLESLNSPYFGRIKFDRKANQELPARIIDTYLGKAAFIDPDTNIPLITDWRAPIANLYYQNTGPANDQQFVAPVGVQKGDLLLKRQFEIGAGELYSIYESKTGNAAADAFLLKQLETRIGKKLQDIVSTIQAQQNEIIREDIGNPTIIQGVAGSGKTTIILHRLAYLFFTYNETIKPENSLIIAPNTMFLDYISDVLPSLGVDGLKQNTYLNWAKDILGWNNSYYINQIDDDNEIKQLKGGKKYLNVVKNFFQFFEVDLFEKMPDFINLEIQARYIEMREQYPDMSILEILDLSTEYAFAQRQFKRKFTGNFNNQLQDQAERIKKIKSYIKKRTNPYTLYKELIDHPEIFKESGFSTTETERIITYTKKVFKRGSKGSPYKLEDLPGMVWLHMQLKSIKNMMYDYIVIDEAQDLSIFQLITVSLLAKNNNITIAGDTAQAIIPPFYIQNWQTLIETFKENKIGNINYHELYRCYRTTIEVIEYANKIFAKKFPEGYKLPEAVLRHGDDVDEIKFKTNTAKASDSEIAKLKETINSDFTKDAATVALIARDEDHADQVFERLNNEKTELIRSIHSYKEDDYKDGILVLPVSRAKGLEFDSVFVMDVNNDNYPVDDLSVRLLYVAITRALHRLHIVHSPTPSKLLK